MAVAKRQRRENRTKEGRRTGVRTSGKINNTPGWPNLHRTGPGREKHIKRGAKASSLSPAWGHSSLRVWIDVPSCLEDGFSCYLLNKIELYNTDLSKSYHMVLSRPESYNTVYPTGEGALMSVIPNLCCDETKTEEHTLT